MWKLEDKSAAKLDVGDEPLAGFLTVKYESDALFFMLSSLKLKLLELNVCDEYIDLEAGRSRRLPQGGHGGGCIAARGEENSIIDNEEQEQALNKTLFPSVFLSFSLDHRRDGAGQGEYGCSEWILEYVQIVQVDNYYPIDSRSTSVRV